MSSAIAYNCMLSLQLTYDTTTDLDLIFDMDVSHEVPATSKTTEDLLRLFFDF